MVILSNEHRSGIHLNRHLHDNDYSLMKWNSNSHENDSNPIRPDFNFCFNFEKKEAQWYEKFSKNSTAKDEDAAEIAEKKNKT